MSYILISGKIFTREPGFKRSALSIKNNRVIEQKQSRLYLNYDFQIFVTCRQVYVENFDRYYVENIFYMALFDVHASFSMGSKHTIKC